MPAAFPALTYPRPGAIGAADKVDISILARDPRNISTSAPGNGEERRAGGEHGSDGKPSTFLYNEELLPGWAPAAVPTTCAPSC